MAPLAITLAHMTIHFGGATVPSESGFRTGLLVGSGGAIVAALVVLAIPRQRRAAPAGEVHGAVSAVALPAEDATGVAR